MKKLIILLILFAATISCSSTGKIKKENRDQLTKDYVFCNCLKYGLGNDIYSKINEVDMSLGMLFEISDAMSYYKELDSLIELKVSQFQPSQIIDHDNKKSIIYDCLELSRSKKIDSLLMKHNK